MPVRVGSSKGLGSARLIGRVGLRTLITYAQTEANRAATA